MYSTTKEFLRYFGLNAVTDLPRLEEFAEVLGLRPDELELAVEGAESMAGVTAGSAAADAPGASGTPRPDGLRETERPDVGAPEQTERRERTEEEEEGEDGDEGAAGRESARLSSGTVPDLEPGDNRHTVDDRDIVDFLDEA